MVGAQRVLQQAVPVQLDVPSLLECEQRLTAHDEWRECAPGVLRELVVAIDKAGEAKLCELWVESVEGGLGSHRGDELQKRC